MIFIVLSIPCIHLVPIAWLLLCVVGELLSRVLSHALAMPRGRPL